MNTTPRSIEPGPPTDIAAELHALLVDRSAVVAVVGLGYVGLPLCWAMHDAGYRVLGYDVDETKIEKFARGENYLKHLGGDLVSGLSKSARFDATTDSRRLAEADVVVLCVPTPLGRHQEPDLSFLTDSTRMVAETLRRGQLIVLESTTFPGTTRDEVKPVLESTGLACGVDFFLAYSPEREDPGRENTSTRSIPKLLGGVDARSGELALTLYRQVIEQMHLVSSAEVAEAAKLLENIYRAVNIALVNELKVVLQEMDIDVWEVIDAAATKPFGFQPFYPGPGLGGHCIPIDPFYLTWKAKEVGHYTKFIELAGEVNSRMPAYVVSRITDALNDFAKPLHGSEILIVGIAYKPDVDDVRESPAAEIISLLHARGARLSYHDPHVPVFPAMRRYRIGLDSVSLSAERLRECDCVAIITNHSSIDYDLIGEHAKLVVDTRNAMGPRQAGGATVVKA